LSGGGGSRPASPQWDLSFKRKCRARNLIGCDGDHVMIQCDKLLGLGLAERRDFLEKSGLCMFCLKHSAEFECYGRGGLSKPRCTRSGCDGEHTPNVHRLMGEDDAKVSFVAGCETEEGLEAEDKHGVDGDYECEYEWEYEDGGLWVGTVGAVEVLEWGKEVPITTDVPTSVLGGGHPEERETGEQNEEGSDFQVDGDPEEEAARDGWWDLEAGCPDLEDAGVGALQITASHSSPRGTPRPGRPTSAGEQGTRKKQETAADQRWEEARQYTRLRQMLSSGLSSEDEDEGQPGGWRLESYEPP
jgi:hypothetical protein